MIRSPLLRLLALGAAVAALAAFAVGCNDKNPTSPGGGGGGGGTADVTISIVGMAGSNSFSPSPDTVSVGQTVSWKNNDTTTHNATSDGGGFTTTGNIAPGATSTPITMNTAGSFPYHCTIHPTMTGILVVKP